MTPNNQAGEGESTQTQTPAEAATEARVQSILFHQLENAFFTKYLCISPSRNVAGRFSLNCSFFDIIPNHGGEAFGTLRHSLQVKSKYQLFFQLWFCHS